MDLDRFYSHWVPATSVLDALEPTLLLSQVQALGRKDAQLVVRETAAVGHFDPPEQVDRIFDSYLWVLAAYEIIRMLWQKSNGDTKLFQQPTKDLLNHAHDHVTRLRIPLAKMEPRKKNRDTDYALAYPGESTENGSAAWLVSDGIWISRRAVADLLLDLLRQMTSDGVRPA